ncbi:MAG TPA: SigF/SigG family RNA polymerase sporulation sigma factor [Candidatus Blautia faecigallinarum]|uniref:RNA polymerase sigma factor n=1 Tax=Candidatus Blautia faecigallinarum TaxID=2838488 RepID=A0A9D2ISR0_9FIRM|nr:SigF/SigG family RNA polymerase sporulation sigma factor [Candidatus Blautia faecigallinarum]
MNMDHTLALIGRAHQGDKKARDTLFEENVGLVYSVAKRFLGRGVEMEDLFQIGSIGLLKAVDKFDLSYDVQFSTYAVPMIVGEIKRFLRDDGILKVSRSLKESHYRVYQVREVLERKFGREPTLLELSQEMGVPVEELVLILESKMEVESLQKTIYQGEGTEISLLEKLPEKENQQDRILDRIFLEEILDTLDAKQRQLIYMRYYKDMTQTEIARELGISQVQVSRMEKKILIILRERVRQRK